MRATLVVLTILLSSVASADSTVVLSTGKPIRPFDLVAIDSPANAECLTYDSATGLFEWATCGAGGGAPTDAQYIVAAADGTLSAERVCTDTATIDCDAGTAGQMKFNLITPLQVATGCATPNFGFVDDTGAGVCLNAANETRLQIGTTDYVQVDVNQFIYVKNSATVMVVTGNGLTLGSTSGTADWFVLTPQVTGAAGRYGELTTADLTANRTYTFPDATGAVLVGQVTDTQIADGAVDGGTGGEIADNSITPADIDETQDYSFTTLSGKQDRNNSAVNDDDCTGEQGLWWYDTTDSAFEFCNANSGTPTVLGGGAGAPTDAKYVVAEANGSLSAEVAPSAADQVAVSDSTTGATWQTLPNGTVSFNTTTNAFSQGTTNYTHATDCTALTTGISGDLCTELDSERLFSCQPTAGGCDTAGEWILTGDGGSAALPVTDTTSIAEGSSDDTKEVRFEVDGITTGTVRVLTVPNADITLQGTPTAGTGISISGSNGSYTYSADGAVINHFTTGTGSPPGTCTAGKDVYVETDQLRACICSDTNTWSCNGKLRAHATDCTALTDGLADEMCFERDADTVYVCEPSAGGCDTAGEWKQVAGGSGAPTTSKYIVAEADGTLSAEVAPSAADQVPVSDSTTAATWRTLPDGPLSYSTSSNTFTAAALDYSVTSIADEMLSHADGSFELLGVLGWRPLDIAGSGSSNAAAQGGDTSHPGVVLLPTTSASNDATLLTMYGAGPGYLYSFALGTSGDYSGWEAIYIFKTGSAVTTSGGFVGFANAANTFAHSTTSAIGVYWDTTTHTCSSGTGSTSDFVLITRQASTDTCVTTGVTVAANTWYRVRLWSTTLGTVNAAVSTSGGAYSGTVTNSTNTPTAKLTPVWQVITRTTDSRSIYPDWWGFRGIGVAR